MHTDRQTDRQTDFNSLHSYARATTNSLQIHSLLHSGHTDFFSMPQRHNSVPGSIIVQVSRSHTIKHTHTHTHTHTRPVRLLCTGDQPLQKLLPTQHTTNTRNENQCTQRDSNPLPEQSNCCRHTP
jgi:hypothetical protein